MHCAENKKYYGHYIAKDFYSDLYIIHKEDNTEKMYDKNPINYAMSSLSKQNIIEAYNIMTHNNIFCAGDLLSIEDIHGNSFLSIACARNNYKYLEYIVNHTTPEKYFRYLSKDILFQALEHENMYISYLLMRTYPDHFCVKSKKIKSMARDGIRPIYIQKLLKHIQQKTYNAQTCAIYALLIHDFLLFDKLCDIHNMNINSLRFYSLNVLHISVVFKDTRILSHLLSHKYIDIDNSHSISKNMYGLSIYMCAITFIKKYISKRCADAHDKHNIYGIIQKLHRYVSVARKGIKPYMEIYKTIKHYYTIIYILNHKAHIPIDVAHIIYTFIPHNKT
jgi:hypothetical protein